jgi:hypothetical protein
VSGTLATNATVVTWYVGQIMPGPAPGVLPITLHRWQFASIPGFQTFGNSVISVNQGEHLIAGLTGIAANADIALNASIEDQPAFGAQAAYAILE